jgi:hypothetical protein
MKNSSNLLLKKILPGSLLSFSIVLLAYLFSGNSNSQFLAFFMISGISTIGILVGIVLFLVSINNPHICNKLYWSTTATLNIFVALLSFILLGRDASVLLWIEYLVNFCVGSILLVKTHKTLGNPRFR